MDVTYLPHIVFEAIIIGFLLCIWVVFLNRWRVKKSRIAKLFAIVLGLNIFISIIGIYIQVIRHVLPESPFPVGSVWYNILEYEQLAFFLFFLANYTFHLFSREVFSASESGEPGTQGKF